MHLMHSLSDFPHTLVSMKIVNICLSVWIHSLSFPSQNLSIDEMSSVFPTDQLISTFYKSFLYSLLSTMFNATPPPRSATCSMPACLIWDSIIDDFLKENKLLKLNQKFSSEGIWVIGKNNINNEIVDSKQVILKLMSKYSEVCRAVFLNLLSAVTL